MATPDEDGWVDITRHIRYPKKVEKRDMVNFSKFLLRGMSFQSNLERLGEKEFKKRGAKYFVIIEEDLAEFKDVEKNGSREYPYELLANWTEHAKINEKRLVIRAFIYKEIEERVVHVLTEDVLEMIPILLERQKQKPESYADELAELREKWKVEDPNLTRSIKTEEFKKIMNAFKVDKSHIVIVLDSQSYLSTLRTLYYGTGPVTTYNRDGNLIMTAHQALFHIFQSTVYGYNWHELKRNPSNRKKFDEYYKFFGDVTRKYWDMEHGILVTMSLVEKDVKTLNDHKIFTKKWARKVRLHSCESSNYLDTVPLKQLSNDCTNLGVSRISSEFDVINVPLYVSRTDVLYGYTEIFYPDEVVEQKMVLVDGLLTLMDFVCRVFYRKKMQKTIYEKAGKEESKSSRETNLEESNEVDAEDEVEEEEEEEEEEPASTDNSPCNQKSNNSSTYCSNHSKLCMVVTDNFDPSTAVAKKQTFKIVRTSCRSFALVPFTPPPPKPKVITHPVLLSNSCNQCFENIGKLKTAEEKLKNAESKAKMYEKQAMKTEELEKEMEILKTKRENADKHRMKAKTALDKAMKHATNNEKRAKEADELEEKLKVKNAKLEENKKDIEKLKITITSQPHLAQKVIMLEERHKNQEEVKKELRESKNQFKSQNADLKKQLENQTQRNELDQKHFATNYERMQNEMAGNRTLSNELATLNLTLVKENDQLKATLVSEKAASEEKSDINARLMNEKVQLYQKIRDLERQLEKSNGGSGSQ